MQAKKWADRPYSSRRHQKGEVANRVWSNACEASRPGGSVMVTCCPSPHGGARVAVSGLGWRIVSCGGWVCVGMPHRHVRPTRSRLRTHTCTRGAGTGIGICTPPARPPHGVVTVPE